MRFLRLAVMAVLLVAVQPVHAAGVVTNCSTYGPGAGTLEAALAGGGTITFACSGTIIVPGIDFVADTTLDGSGQNVILSGNHASYVLYVTTSVTVTLKNLTIMNGHSVDGGGITNGNGDLTLDHVTVSNNVADGDTESNGGGISNYYGTLTITDSTIKNNRATHYGGGIFNHYGTLDVTDSTISNNSAEGGAGIHNYDGIMTVTDSTISNNTLVGDNPFGGGIANYYLPATITGSTISGNSGGQSAKDGGISGYRLTIRDSVISGNSVGNGIGGVHAIGLTMTNSQVINNHSGGAYGGILTQPYPGNTSTINGSLIAGNTAHFDMGGVSAKGDVVITNTTITDNHAERLGGGIGVDQGVTIINSTIVGNSALDGGAGIHAFDTNTISNTIIANNGGSANCALDEAAFISTNNLSDDNSCPDFTQTTLANLHLGALTGIPAYFPLRLGSVAIDAGSIDFCPDTDQRGAPRPQGLGCDIGAYEYTKDVPDRNFFDTATPTLTWNRVSWAEGYTVEVDDNADFSSPEFRDDTLGISALSVQTGALTQGRYYWRVCAHVNANTCGKWSVVESFWVEG